MSDLDLEAIEARAKAATPGPWVVGPGAFWNYVVGSDEHGDHAGAQEKEDAAFIAASREDVPALVAEVRRLRAEVAALSENTECAHTWRATMTVDIGVGRIWECTTCGSETYGTDARPDMDDGDDNG